MKETEKEVGEEGVFINFGKPGSAIGNEELSVIQDELKTKDGFGDVLVENASNLTNLKLNF